MYTRRLSGDSADVPSVYGVDFKVALFSRYVCIYIQLFLVSWHAINSVQMTCKLN